MSKVTNTYGLQVAVLQEYFVYIGDIPIDTEQNMKLTENSLQLKDVLC